MSSEIESVEANVSSDEEGSGEDVEKSPKLSPKKEEKPPKENNKKSPAKQPKEEEEEEESGGNESNESAPEENNEEPKLGLLDQPVEISGSRERKKVQRLEYSITTPSKEKHEIPEGSGEKLGECPRIEFQLQKTKTDELKILHRILFNRPGSGNEIKKNLRRFSGFTFAKDSPEYEKKKNNIDKITIPVLKHICEILDLERSGTKEDVSVRLLDFLLSPKASGKKVPATKKRSSKGEKHKQKPGKEKSEKKILKKKQESSDEDEEASEPEENEEEDEVDEKEQDEEEEEEEEEDIEVDDDDDSELDERKTKRSRSSKSGKDKKKRESKSKKSDEKKPVKSTKKSKKEASSEESSDDEPLAKKAKGPPTDEEIKQLVKKILDGANLEEITMKKVIKQVFDDYPEFDLGDKKDFIKSTVRSLIS